MDSATTPQRRTGNHLLDMLPNEERRRVGSSASAIELVAGEGLYEAESRISSVYFPTSGVASLLTPTSDGKWIETALVGREGIVGIRAFLGGGTSGNERAIGQVPGKALEIGADTFRGHVESGGKLRDVMFAYTQALLSQTAQSVVCNAVHEIQERCARWMLQVHDRVDGDEFSLTHEFLADMLAVRRSSVTVAAGALQEAGLIRYRRGHVTVVNRPGLEEASCECYGSVVDGYARALGSAPPPF
jgi:CRP-like cAMP-binding protein